MALPGKTGKNGIIDRNISYYNEVAGSYDSIMHNDQSNKIVRENVKEEFLATVEPGWVLDFGGGTGLDLDWLTIDYNVIFCEPSIAMREKAIEYNTQVLQKSNVIFLESPKTDFTTWPRQRPFSQLVNGVLCNFGVINYIPDIGHLFNSLAGVIKPGGHLLGIILDLSFKKRLKWHRKNALRSLIFGSTFKMYIPYKEHKQTVFVYTTKEVQNAAGKYFQYQDSPSFTGFDFTLIHLVRNEKSCQEMANG